MKSSERGKNAGRSRKPDLGPEIGERMLSPEERSFEAILARERTEEVNSEGYHFVRPRWHRWVYGGGRKSEKG